jgi:hypothetical protein
MQIKNQKVSALGRLGGQFEPRTYKQEDSQKKHRNQKKDPKNINVVCHSTSLNNSRPRLKNQPEIINPNIIKTKDLMSSGSLNKAKTSEANVNLPKSSRSLASSSTWRTEVSSITNNAIFADNNTGIIFCQASVKWDF